MRAKAGRRARLWRALLVCLAAAALPATPPATAAPRCLGRPATVVGSARGQLLRGTPAADTIAALGGDDVVRGRGGSDLVCGGRGEDRLHGNGGHDALAGGRGRDLLRGARGDDRLVGALGGDVLLAESGDDTLRGGVGRDYLLGGAGNDVHVGGPDNDRLVMYYRGGADVGRAGAGADYVDTRDGMPDDVVDGGHGVDRCSRTDPGDVVRDCP